MVGVEPTCCEAHEPESCVSANSTTSAKMISVVLFSNDYFCSMTLFSDFVKNMRLGNLPNRIQCFKNIIYFFSSTSWKIYSLLLSTPG